ncbi:nucleoside hydrolase [Nocardia noduli]|uniref:nucleoside hydrolase n=1 Tax=Nocardia noduli TaxID=2815722 RepID=UPI001C22A04D|nr:nucleoside hydrolase [Nocardia noduli]
MVDVEFGDSPDQVMAVWLAARLLRNLALVVTGGLTRRGTVVAADLIRASGRDIPVVAGMRVSQAEQCRTDDELFSHEGPHPLADGLLEEVDGLATRYPEGQIVWITLGPATNLARVLSARPDLAHRLVVVVQAGTLQVPGAREAESNVAADPVAMRAVLAAAPGLSSFRMLLSEHAFNAELGVGAGSRMRRVLHGLPSPAAALLGGSRRWLDVDSGESTQAGALAVAWAAGLPFVEPQFTSIAVTEDGRMYSGVAGEYRIHVSRAVKAPLFAAWLDRQVDDGIPCASGGSAGLTPTAVSSATDPQGR